ARAVAGRAFRAANDAGSAAGRAGFGRLKLEVAGRAAKRFVEGDFDPDFEIFATSRARRDAGSAGAAGAGSGRAEESLEEVRKAGVFAFAARREGPFASVAALARKPG